MVNVIEWIHTATKLEAYNPDRRRRGMIVKKTVGDGIAYKVFIDGGAYAGSSRTMGEARELCRKELEEDGTDNNRHDDASCISGAD